MILRDLKLRLRHRRLRRHGIAVDCRVATVSYGHRGSGEWTICPAPISTSSVVYSFGVGTDVSWDLAMIQHHGVTVHAFDPTPGSVQWVKARTWPAQFQFHPIGIASYDGTMEFFPPRTERTVHFSPMDRGYEHDPRDKVEAPVHRLSTIMRQVGCAHVDVLKLDIEGGEYDVLPDVLDSGIPVGQFLIEFHHNYKTLSLDHTLNSVAALRRHGYRIFHISNRALEFSFIHDSALA